MDETDGIGFHGEIPWNEREDRFYFRNLTMGHKVIMGRRTYDSLPRVLDGREVLVIGQESKVQNILYAPASTRFFTDPWECVKYCQETYDGKPVYVAGGAQIYSWFNNNRLISEHHVTHIPGVYDCDAFYPSIINMFGHRGIGSGKPGDKLQYKIYHENNYAENQFRSIAGYGLTSQPIRRGRGGVETKSTFGETLTFQLTNNTFPLLTTRKMFLRGIFEELKLFISGKTDSKLLEDQGVNVWKKNTSREFLDSRGLQHLPEGDMGPSYGFLMRHYGAEYKTCKTDYKGQGVDQLGKVIETIKNNPTDRRMIISLWDPTVLDAAPLPPCLYNYQFYVREERPASASRRHSMMPARDLYPEPTIGRSMWFILMCAVFSAVMIARDDRDWGADFIADAFVMLGAVMIATAIWIENRALNLRKQIRRNKVRRYDQGKYCDKPPVPQPATQPRRYLDCMMTQRSSDFAVAGGWNVATGALLTIMIARVTGLEPGTLKWNIGDLHLYKDHEEEFVKQLRDKITVAPKLFVAPRDNIEDFVFSDLTLLNYAADKKYKYDMIA